MERWLVEVDGEATGPFDGDAVTRRVASRELTAATRLRKEGTTPDEWKELRDIPRFARMLPTTFASSSSASARTSAPQLGAPLDAPVSVTPSAVKLIPPDPFVLPAPLEMPPPVEIPAPPVHTFEAQKLEALLDRVHERRLEPHDGSGEEERLRHERARLLGLLAKRPKRRERAHPHYVAHPRDADQPHMEVVPLDFEGARSLQRRPPPIRPARRQISGVWVLAPILLLAAMSFTIGITLHGRDDATAAATTITTGGSTSATAKPTATSKAPTKLGIANIVEGSGPAAKAGDRVRVSYTGTLTDGTVFDSTGGGAPFEFVIGKGNVIKGWDQGIPGMKVGGKRRLTVPPSLAYGSRGASGKIPPNATLLFDVELVTIVGK